MWSEQVVIGPCSHPCCPLLCRRTHWADTKQREKLRISSCLSGQQQRAARLGLRWPPKPQNAKRAGRPTFARLWVLALEQAIRDGHLPEHVESAMPSWWRPGMPVWRSESDVAADMEDAPCAGASLEPITELIDLTEDSDDVELCATSKKRARRIECSPAVKELFCNLTVCHPDWSVAECVRHAKRLAPELFQVHIQTPRKWLRPGHAHVRPAVLGPAHVTELVDLGQRISEGISCGSSIFRFAFNQRLEALGCTYRFGPRDCRRFLRQMDLKWRQTAGEKRKWSDSDVREHRELTARKLVWALNDAGVHPSRQCNIDETATRPLPIGEKGWLRPGAAPIVNKAYITTVFEKVSNSYNVKKDYSYLCMWMTSSWLERNKILIRCGKYKTKKLISENQHHF